MSAIALFLSWGSTSAHNLDQRDTYISFDEDTLAVMAVRVSMGQPLIQAGDIIGMILKSTPGPGTDTGVGGYMTFYIPEGTQVVGVDYLRPDGTGNLVTVPIKGQSIIAIGSGPVGPATTPDLIGLNLGPNYLGVTEAATDGSGEHRGTIAGVYADTGIFYSTDPDTTWLSWQSSGGFDGNPVTSDNNVTNNRGETIVPITKWDAEQLLAYGSKNPILPIVDPNGRGNTPWGLGNVVAGPESGYAWEFDRDVFTATMNMQTAVSGEGPWQRIKYPGSQISNDMAGLQSSELGYAGDDASDIGVELTELTPLPPTLDWSDSSCPKAIRVSYGLLELGRAEYSRVRLKILADPGQPNSPFDANGCFEMWTDAFGGDAGGEQGGKDHLWRYYDPTVVNISTCGMIQKVASDRVVEPNQIFQYEIQVINTSTAPLTNAVVTDSLPNGVTFLSTVPAQDSGPNPLVWNFPSIPAESVQTITLNVRATGSGDVFNTVTLNSDQGSSTSMESVFIGFKSVLNGDKTVTPSSVAPGATVTYALSISNDGTGTNGTPLTISEFLPGGFTYVSMVSQMINGGLLPGANLSVDSSDPNRPVFTVTQGIDPGEDLVLEFDVLVDAAQPVGTYTNSYSYEFEDKTLATGPLAPVTVGGASLGDTIYRDWDGDGVEDPEDEGLPGVTVGLYDVTGLILLDSDVTDANGDYGFTGLVADDYVVRVDSGVPAGYTLTGDPVGGLDGEAAVTLALNEENLGIDFGYQPGGTGSIGDLVFEDVGNDGGYDAGTDNPIANVTVNLYEDVNGNGVVDGADALIGTDSTDGSGIYGFSGLAEGLDYLVRVDEADSDLVAFFSPSTFIASTGNPILVSSLSGSFTDADVGFFELLPGSIGDEVFIDNDGDGTFSGGDTPVANAGMVLYRDVNGDGLLDGGDVMIGTTTTDISGNYVFDLLGPGDYIVDIDIADPDLPSGYSPTRREIAVNIPVGIDVTTVDFPLVQLVMKTVDKATATDGEILAYTLEVIYPGPDLLTNVVVSDPIPAETTFLSAGQGGYSTTMIDLTGTKDAYNKEDKMGQNNGFNVEVKTKPDATKMENGFIEFDLSSIPPGATITAATLELDVTNVAASQTVSVHAVTAAWNEGELTWDDRTTGVAWGTAGGDYDPAVVATFMPTALGNLSTDILSLVEDWHDGTTTNYGLILVPSGAAGEAKYSSREGAVAPVLTVTYASGMVMWDLGSNTAAVGGSDPGVAAGMSSITLTSVADTEIWSGDANGNYGGNAEMWTAGLGDLDHSIILFDLSSIHASATITSASIRLNRTGGSGGDVAAHRLLASWLENEATWNDRSTGVPWATAGGDYDPTPEAVTAMGGNGFYTWGLATLVQDWVNGTANNGVLIKQSNEGAAGDNSFDTREDGTPANQPRLTVDYNVSAQAATTTDISVSSVLVTDGGGGVNATVSMTVSAAGAVTGINPTALTVLPGASGAGATLVSGPTGAPASFGGGGGSATFTWVYSLTAGSLPDEVRFSGGATGTGATFGNATSHGVIITPLLTMTVTIDNPATLDFISNYGRIEDDGVLSLTPSNTVYTALTGSIGDRVWADLNGDGVQDAGEPGIARVEVTITNGIATYMDTTDALGNYLIFGLAADTWTVTVDPATFPAGYSPTTATSIDITLGAVEQNLDADFGLRPPPVTPASIGDQLWIDADEDGIFDFGELALPSITVNLYNDVNDSGTIDGGDLFVATTTTDAGGLYSFTSLYPGEYLVEVDESSAVTTPQGGGTTIAAAMDLVTGTNPHDVSGLIAGQNYTAADFGYNWDGLIGDTVFYDDNANEVQDGLETGAPDVVLNLFNDVNSNGSFDPGIDTAFAVAFTDAGGAYLFDNLPPGDYIVNAEEQTVPAPPSSPNAGMTGTMVPTTGDNLAVTLAASENHVDADFGFIEAALVEGHVFHDENRDGLLGGGETGLLNITVTLTGTDSGGGPVSLMTLTDVDGEYQFLPPPGDYTISYDTGDPDIPANLTDVTNFTSVLLTAVAGQEYEDIDFGRDDAGTVGDRIFSDNDGNGSQGAGESGLGSVTVTLYDAAGTTLLDTEVTDANGDYLFEGLPDAIYVVRVVTASLPPGYNPVPTADPNGPLDSEGITVMIGVGGSDLTMDFGYQLFAVTWAVSGTVWDDDGSGGGIAGNGIQDGTEPGISGVTVTAEVDLDNDLIPDQTFVTTTDGTGGYGFTGITDLADVTIIVDDATLPNTAYVQTGDPDVMLDHETTILNIAANATGQDFGYEENFGSIAGTVVRGNGNGVAEGGEPPIPGVAITLTYAGADGILGTGDDVVQMTATNGTGDYSFTGLFPGLHRIEETDPVGFGSRADADGGNPNSISLTLGLGENSVDQDFEDGLLLDITGRVIDDANANGVDDAESGIVGVTLELWSDPNGDGDPADGAMQATTTTAALGAYSFANVVEGVYVVVETDPGGYGSTNDLDGATANSLNEIAVLLDTVNSTGNDFLDSLATNLGQISGTVWADTDTSGDFSAGDTRLAGVTVELWSDPNGDGDPADGVLITGTTTDLSGNYSFTNLLPDDYVVVETDPAGAASVTDVDGVLLNSNNEVGVTLPIGGDVTGRDFLDDENANLGTIGGTVYDDDDNDNAFSGGDIVVGGVTIELFSDPNGDGDPGDGALLGTTATAGDGTYSFTGLTDGDYVVVETDPSGVSSVTDTDGTTNNTINEVGVTLTGGTPSPPAADFLDEDDTVAGISGRVINDMNANGVEDAESGIPGVTVQLFTDPNGDGDPSDGVVAETVMTAGDGSYGFSNIAAGDYVIVETNLTNWWFSTADTGGANDDWIPVTIAGADSGGNDFLDAFAWFYWSNVTPGANMDPNPDGNTDGDLFEDVEEYAFEQDPSTGVPSNDGFCAALNTGTGNLDAFYIRPIGIPDVGYTLEGLVDLADSPATIGAPGPGGWFEILTIVPSVTDNGDGTETVRYENLESVGVLAGGKGFVRLRLDLANPVYSTYTQVFGWERTGNVVGCETCSAPFLNKPTFAGVVDSVAGSNIEVAGSAGAEDVKAAMNASDAYYVEVVGVGDANEGHRFAVDYAASDADTISIDTASSHTTMTSVPDLSGQSIVLRRFQTLGELFDTADFDGTNDSDTADRLLFRSPGDAGMWQVIYLLDAPLQWTEQGDVGMADQAGRVIDPCEGMFVHRRQNGGALLMVGMVRANDFACPLLSGYNLVNGGWPMDLSPEDRDMELAVGFFFGGFDPSAVDQFHFWLGDATPSAEGYDGYFLLDAGAPYQYWTGLSDSLVTNRDGTDLFLSNRSALIKVTSDRTTYEMPRPWTP